VIYPCHGTKRRERATGKPLPNRIYTIVFLNPERYAFIDFRNADAAAYVLNELNRHPFDTKHTFLVNSFADIENFADLAFLKGERFAAAIPIWETRNRALL
jgi:hypothetical protein